MDSRLETSAPRITDHLRGRKAHVRPVFVLLAALLMPLSAAAQLEPLVLDGDPAPGTGGRYSFLGIPARNDSGEVAFTASISSGTTIGGVFVESPSESRAVALRGEPAPGAGGATFQNFLSAAINASGDVVFYATLSGGSAPGIFLDGPAGLVPIVRNGDPAPGTSGGVFSSVGLPAINDAGTIAFSSLISGGIPSAGVFRFAAGSFSPVVLNTDPVPDLPGAVFTSFARPGIGASGEIAFQATMVGPTNVPTGLFADVGGSLSAVVLDGDPAPDTGGSTYGNLSDRPPAVSPTGAIAFSSGYGGGALVGTGIFRVSGTTHSAIALMGEPAPDAGGATFLNFPDGAAINAAGDVTFTAQLTSPPGSGVFVSRSGMLETVALTDDPAPGAFGNFSSFGSRPSIDTAGAIAFSGVVNAGAANSGIWLLPEPATASSLALGSLLLARLARRRRSAVGHGDAMPRSSPTR